MISGSKFAVLLTLIAVLPAASFAQTKRKAKTKTSAATTTSAAPLPTPAPTPKNTIPSKRNERPGDAAPDRSAPKDAPQPPNYYYEFDRPGFTYPSIFVEHDEAGRGQITFVRTGNDIAIADPIELSSLTLKNLKDAFTALNFLDSNETYQTPRDYSTMGNVTITLKRDGRQRTVKYNWSDNRWAKVLADEYRRISNQYIWQFEMSSARENQPLQAPALMDQLDDYLRRQEISDPQQMLPILRQFSNDERIPLMARNHAGKLAAQIEKSKK